MYIHVPFCAQKCRYCDFTSFGGSSRGLMERYVTALCTEIALVDEQLDMGPHTIFIGGGTPSVLPTDLLERLLRAVQRFVTPQLAEYTVEANPGTVDEEKLALLRRYGANRLSMGVQSADDGELALLGRTHTFAEAMQGLAMARAAGFGNINLDLIYGLPGQTLAVWEKTLLQVLSQRVEHLSLYQLKIEEGTVLAQWQRAGRIAEFDDETAWEMYQLAYQQLEARGYQQYEISNYARPDRESLHNQAYWRTADYIGLGLAAHSFLRPVRRFNPSRMSDYLAPLAEGRLPMQEEEALTVRQCMEETIFMGLRMLEGVDLDAFARRYGERAEKVFAPAIAKCWRNGHLEIVDNALRLTESGRVLGNLVFVEFV